MKTGKWTVHRWSAAAAGVALLAAPLGSGLVGAGGAAAQSQSYPLVSSTGAQIGVVEFDLAYPVQQFAITLDGARPDTTYVVSACSTDLYGNVSCVSDAEQDSVTTDALGNAHKLVSVMNGPIATEITLTDTADSSDLVAGGPSQIVNTGGVPAIIIVPSAQP